MPRPKLNTATREKLTLTLSVEGKKALAHVSAEYGISQSAIVEEFAIKELKKIERKAKAKAKKKEA